MTAIFVSGMEVFRDDGFSVRKHGSLHYRLCVYLCLSDETLKAVGPFYLVSMPGEVKQIPPVCTGNV